MSAIQAGMSCIQWATAKFAGACMIRPGHRIFLRSLPAALAENPSALRSICTHFGEVEDVWVRVVNRTATVHESWGFVRFSTAEGAHLAAAGDWQQLLVSAGFPGSVEVLPAEAELEVSESLVAQALDADAKGAAHFDFESFREHFSQQLGRPVLRRDAELIFQVLRKQRPDISVKAQLSSAKDAESGSGSGILIITAYSTNYAPGNICAAANHEYAAKHGYDFLCDALPGRDMLEAVAPRDAHTWYKVLMLRRVMAEGQHSHVLWVDADAVVIDQAKTLDSFIQEAEGRDLIIQEDLSAECRVNCGVMILRRSKWSSCLLRLLWEGNLSRRHHCKPYYEQSALVRLLIEAGELESRPQQRLQRPALSPKVCILPQRRLQTNRLREVQLDGPERSFIFHPLFASEHFAEDKAEALQRVCTAAGVLCAEKKACR
ncbi:unnamed protein product [Effrenium voratum]|nr:unnamed protein product [Effrenium voratum]